jgi:hypothetical protein
MIKFFTTSKKMEKKLNPIWIELWYVYVYMVGEWNEYQKWILKTKKYKFKDIFNILKNSFASLQIVKHNYWTWFWIDIEELKQMWINKIDWYFELEWKYLNNL